MLEEAVIDLEVGKPWYDRSGTVKTPLRKYWGWFALLTLGAANTFYIDILEMLIQKRILRLTPGRSCHSCANVLAVVGFCMGGHAIFFLVVAFSRFPGPYKLHRSEKQMFDCAFVVVCSCWTVCMRGRTNTTVIGLIYSFHVIPMLNLWWDFVNFGVWDCLLAALIEAALFCCRDYGLLFTTVVAGVGVALQLKKNAYQENSIKSTMDK